MSPFPLNRLLIAQGRFRPSGASESASPAWNDEFEVAAELGLDGLCWQLGTQLSDNPLWSPQGRRRIRRLHRSTGICVSAVHANYFSEHSIDAKDDAARLQSAAMLRRFLADAADVGAQSLLVPIPDDHYDFDLRRGLKTLEAGIRAATASGVTICLHGGPKLTDQLMHTLPDASLGACWDDRGGLGGNACRGPSVVRLQDCADESVAQASGLFQNLGAYAFEGDLIIAQYFETPAAMIRQAVDWLRAQLRAASHLVPRPAAPHNPLPRDASATCSPE